MVNENLTELPNKWMIRITNENEDLINLARKRLNSHYNYPILRSQYPCLANNSTNSNYPNDIIGNGTETSFSEHIEITTEQFKKWVLKEENLIDIVLW